MAINKHKSKENINIEEALGVIWTSIQRGEDNFEEVSKTVKQGVDENIINDLYKNNIISIKKNKEDQIETVEYNNYLISKYTDQVTKILEEELKKDIYNIKIPITAIFNNNLLNNISPKIKIKTNNISSVICNIDLKSKEYGINNVIIEIYLTIMVERKITLPLISDNIKVEMNNPISYIVINGKTPDYYKNDFNTNNNDETSIENKN